MSLSFKDALAYCNCERHFSEITERWKLWHEKNDIDAIVAMLYDNKYTIASKLHFYIKHLLKCTEYNSQIIDIDIYKNSLQKNCIDNGVHHKMRPHV